MRLFLKKADFEAFEQTIGKTLQICPMRILGQLNGTDPIVFGTIIAVVDCIRLKSALGA